MTELLDFTTVQTRLGEMQEDADPKIRWDETCEGSARSLVIFVGPSPGGPKPPERRPMNRNCFSARWDVTFDKPWKEWSNGFKQSFKPLVEALFDTDYGTAGKLIGRANLDWISDPQAENVEECHMLEGAPSVLKMIEDCSPELVLPMENKAFTVLRKALEDAGYRIIWCDIKEFTLQISPSAQKFHKTLYAFFATSPKGHDFIVMKLPQHPARMMNANYATRCGAAIRKAARQMASGKSIDVAIMAESVPGAPLQIIEGDASPLDEAFHEETLLTIQHHFHDLIRSRSAGIEEASTLVLPELEPLLAAGGQKTWLPVPGMYGGFSYWLEGKGAGVKLITESWCRVVEGSGQRHEITSEGSELVAEGFV